MVHFHVTKQATGVSILKIPLVRKNAASDVGVYSINHIYPNKLVVYRTKSPLTRIDVHPCMVYSGGDVRNPKGLPIRKAGWVSLSSVGTVSILLSPKVSTPSWKLCISKFSPCNSVSLTTGAGRGLPPKNLFYTVLTAGLVCVGAGCVTGAVPSRLVDATLAPSVAAFSLRACVDIGP